MKKYIIKVTSVATDNNPNFCGETKVYYYGKGSEGPWASTEDKCLVPYIAKNYGYSTVASARAVLKAKQSLCDWETNKGFWKSTCELVEVTID